MLSRDGKDCLGHMLGEVIDNCELHGGQGSKWYTMGYYHINNQHKYGECHLVILNFGNSIYERLRNESVSIETIQALEKLTSEQFRILQIKPMVKRKFINVYALQDGVSRLRSESEPDRGNGTIILIDSFQSIGMTSGGNFPAMSITSGRTHILFDETYRLAQKEYDGEQRAIIAFNVDNDLFKPPDPKNVKSLSNHFPGTAISIKFYIDRAYLETKVGE